MDYYGKYVAATDALECMRDFLNDGKYDCVTLSRSDSEELHELMEDWLGAGMHWNRFFLNRIDAAKDVRFLMKGTFSIELVGGCPLLLTFPPDNEKLSIVKCVFQRFFLHPECRRLSSRCKREQCRRYFIRNSAHAQIYCSSRCARLETAVTAIRKKRKAEHEALVEKVKAAFRKYESITPNRRPKDRRRFVEDETGITSRKLSGLLSHGRIQKSGENATAPRSGNRAKKGRQ